MTEESRSVSYNHFAGSDNPQSLGLGSASAESGQGRSKISPMTWSIWSAGKAHPPWYGGPSPPAKASLPFNSGGSPGLQVHPPTNGTPLSSFPWSQKREGGLASEKVDAHTPQSWRKRAGVRGRWRGRKEGGLRVCHAVGPVRVLCPRALHLGPVARRAQGRAGQLPALISGLPSLLQLPGCPESCKLCPRRCQQSPQTCP